MREDLMEDFKEFEDNQEDLENFISNGIINEEQSCHESLEIMSANSFGMDQMSDYLSNKNCNF